LGDAQYRYAGIVALDQWGNAIFETPAAGRAAQQKLLLSRFGQATVEQMVLGYSTADYSGATHHNAQVDTIYRVANTTGVDLRGKTIGTLSARELDALCDGINRFEGYRIGTTRVLSGPALHSTAVATASTPHPDAPMHPSAPPMRAAATHHDAPLRQGDQGPAVRALQAALNRLDVTDARGHRLVEDGHFGRHTREAVVRFQHAHGLPEPGIAGPRTAQALRREQSALVSAPRHPDHALYARVLELVHVAEVGRGISPGAHSENLAGALTVAARRAGISHVDRVEFNRDGALVRAVQASPLGDVPWLNRTTGALATGDAVRQSVHASSGQLAQVQPPAMQPRPQPPQQARVL